MNTRHLQFCLNYLQTHDPGVAYKMAYPKANNNSVYAAASRLMARPDVSAWIAETEQRMHNRVMRQVEQEQGDTLKEQLLTINQKRAVLTKIITGETKRVRHIKTKYSYEKVEDDLPIYAVLRAIDMDTRLENFYNLLTNPHTWRKAQTFYVNTPTLQQQVNVLINQSSQQTTDEQTQRDTSVPTHNTSTRGNEVSVDSLKHFDLKHELSPAGGGDDAGVGGGPLAQENMPTDPKHNDSEMVLSTLGWKIEGQITNNETVQLHKTSQLLVPQISSRRRVSVGHLASKKNNHTVFTPPRLSTAEKTPHYLTKLNKMHRKHDTTHISSPDIPLTPNSLFLNDINVNERK